MADISIEKHKIYIYLKNTIFTANSWKNHESSLISGKHDHVILHDLFAKSVASNEAQKNQRIQGKRKVKHAAHNGGHESQNCEEKGMDSRVSKLSFFISVYLLRWHLVEGQ